MTCAVIKAIETEYKGYRFRSRLEARWAVFFDELKLKWEYEPQGFVLSDGARYLPDFRVKTPQGSNCWYEVKPAGVTGDTKFTLFSKLLNPENLEAWEAARDAAAGAPEAVLPESVEGTRCSLLVGDPIEYFGSEGDKGPFVCPRCGLVGHFATGWYEGSFGCEMCDWETPLGGGHPWEIGVAGVLFRPHKGSVVAEQGWEETVIAAGRMARAARFEHGQYGAPWRWSSR